MKKMSVKPLTQWMIPRMTMAGCHITDIQRTLGNITSNTMWPEQWGETASIYLELAKKAESAGHKETAYSMYIYAMLYYYEGQKILFEESESKTSLFKNMLNVYDKVLEFCNYPIEKVEIEWNGIKLPAILHKPKTDKPFPCLVFIQGMDSSKEEWHNWGKLAVERGIGLLCVDTPGHGSTRHLMGVNLEIPNVVDAASTCRSYLESREDVISGKVGVLGNCLGSNYGFQSAANDPNFACCLIILSIAETKIKTGEQNVPKWFTDMIKFHTGDVNGKTGNLLKYEQDFKLENMKRRVTCPTHLFHPKEDNWLDWEQVEKMGSYVDGDLTITAVEGEPVFEGNIMSHLVPIYEQMHWILPVAFDWVKDVLDK